MIDANKFGLTSPMDGSTRYVNSLLKAMHKEHSNEFEFFLLFNRKIVLIENAINHIELFKQSPPAAISRIRMRINRIFEQFKIIRNTVFSVKSYLFLKKIKSYQFDIIHVLLPHRYYFIKGYLPNTILVMSIHDLTCKIVPQFHLYANTQTTWSGIVYSSLFCEGIICVSENTKKDFLKFFPSYNGVLAVTYLGFDDKLFYKEFNYNRIGNVRKKYGITSRHYILSLFTLEPRKNLRNLILAVELLRKNSNCRHIELIIAGKLGWKMDKDFEFIRGAAGVKLIGYVEEQDLAPLYTGAVAFCYPSFYEGFGLPLLEAMACGTPVVFGNNSSMPEVVGDAGLGCDANSPKDIMRQLHKICTNNDLRSKLSRESIKRSRHFSWAKCAKETFKVYDKLLYR